jgi:hypothetical protein
VAHRGSGAGTDVDALLSRFKGVFTRCDCRNAQHTQLFTAAVRSGATVGCVPVPRQHKEVKLTLGRSWEQRWTAAAAALQLKALLLRELAEPPAAAVLHLGPAACEQLRQDADELEQAAQEALQRDDADANAAAAASIEEVMLTAGQQSVKHAIACLTQEVVQRPKRQCVRTGGS